MIVSKNVALLLPNVSVGESNNTEKVLRLSDPEKFNTIYRACSEAVDSVLQFFIIKDAKDYGQGKPFTNFL